MRRFFKMLAAIFACICLTLTTPLHSTVEWKEWGRCEVDYTGLLPDCIEALIDSYFERGKELEHHDVFIQTFDSPDDDLQNRAEIKGFFATGEDHAKWAASMSAWFVLGVVVWVEGEMKETESREHCYKFGTGWSNESKYKDMKARYDTNWTKFHLFVRNCQVWTHWVITKVYLDRRANIDDPLDGHQRRDNRFGIKIVK